MARRKSYNVAQRRKIFEDANGICWRCQLPIDTLKEEWHVGHVGKAHAFGGEVVAPEHKSCNMRDCYETVIPAVAKSNRVWSRRNEKRVSRNPVPGSKNSKYKKCLNGDVIERATGKVISKGRAA
jgi:5-methylcytosine-specific restriction protein A